MAKFGTVGQIVLRDLIPSQDDQLDVIWWKWGLD